MQHGSVSPTGPLPVYIVTSLARQDTETVTRVAVIQLYSCNKQRQEHWEDCRQDTVCKLQLEAAVLRNDLYTELSLEPLSYAADS